MLMVEKHMLKLTVYKKKQLKNRRKMKHVNTNCCFQAISSRVTLV